MIFTSGNQEPKHHNEATDYSLIGSVLLSNTTACEASRLQYNHSNERIHAMLVLIESIVLHDRIFYLPATLPDDVAALDLRNLLIENGILEVIPKKEDHDVIGAALLSTFSTVKDFRSGLNFPDGRSNPGDRLSFRKLKPDLMRELRLSKKGNPTIEDGDFRWQLGGRTHRGVENAESFDEAARSLIAGIEYARSGDYEAGVSKLRAMYYVFASEHYRIPYHSAQNSRLWLEKFPNYFQPSARATIYERLASALRTTVDAVAQEYENPIMFIPPFSAIVLDRAPTPTEIPYEVLALRDEYKDFRRKMHDLERSRLEASSLNDRLKALRQLQQLGSEVARPFDQPSEMKLETALRYIPDAAALAANPTNPVQWAKSLIGMPTDMLLNWYRRRPVAKLVRTASTVAEMPGYDALLTKHFGTRGASASHYISRQFQDF